MKNINMKSIAACLLGVGAFASFLIWNMNAYSPLAFPGSPFVSPLLAILAMVTGIVSLRSKSEFPQKGYAWAGIITGGIATAFWAWFAYLFSSGAFNF